MQKNVKDLERTLDLDSVQQVPFKRPQPIGKGTSASAATLSKQVPLAASQDKGKGKMGVEEETPKVQSAPSSEQPQEQQQEQTPPPQTEPPVAPVLQTPAHEERGKKREKEESTPVSGSSQKPESKRQRVDSPEVE